MRSFAHAGHSLQADVLEEKNATKRHFNNNNKNSLDLPSFAKLSEFTGDVIQDSSV